MAAMSASESFIVARKSNRYISGFFVGFTANSKKKIIVKSKYLIAIYDCQSKLLKFGSEEL